MTCPKHCECPVHRTKGDPDDVHEAEVLRFPLPLQPTTGPANDEHAKTPRRWLS